MELAIGEPRAPQGGLPDAFQEVMGVDWLALNRSEHEAPFVDRLTLELPRDQLLHRFGVN
jgi:hypothetical protein